jgi:hypothetical protein
MRRALRGIAFTLLRRRSGLRVKKRARLGGRHSLRVVTVPSAADDARDDRDRPGEPDGVIPSDSVSGAESDSSDVVFVDETSAVDPVGGRTGPDLVRAAASALRARAKPERGMGNCMFCAVSSGINTWLSSIWKSAGKTADEALLHKCFDPDPKEVSPNPPAVTWARLRAALARHLRAVARDAPRVAGVADERGPFASEAAARRTKRRAKRARENAMVALMAGEQGRAWLTRGALRDAPVARRFDRYVESMATDASRFAGQSTWRRFWGADNELVCLATKLRVAMVCVEAATKAGGAFLAVPPDVAEAGAASPFAALDGAPARFGRYVCDGAFETVTSTSTERKTLHAFQSRKKSPSLAPKCLRWRASRGAVTLTVRAARADSKAARRAVGGGDGRTLPALVVVHRPGHFDSLQPEEGYVLVMEREVAK